MAMALWVFLLSLQGCLLTHALDCTGRNVDCVSTQVTEVKVSAVASGFRSFMIEESYTFHLRCKSFVACLKYIFNLSYNLSVVLKGCLGFVNFLCNYTFIKKCIT